MTRNEAIMDAWDKISKYVKDNYTHTFEKGISFRWKHEVYYWIQFGVTYEGDAYIAKGNHSSVIPTEWFYHPDPNKPTFERLKLRCTEEVIDDWFNIKEKLRQLAEKENSLFNFKP